MELNLKTLPEIQHGRIEDKCVCCGSEKVVFMVGNKQKAILNGTDWTHYIEQYYKKGDLLCEDCLFK